MIFRPLCWQTLIFFSCVCRLSAQEYSYAHYDAKDGLSGASIYTAVEDNDGFMWFGTETGLSRFDGTHFSNFTTNDGLPDNEIIKLSVDSKNRVWILPFKNSIAYYFKGVIHNQQNDPILRKLKITNEVQAVVEDKEGDILIQETHNIHIISIGGTVTEIDSIDGERFITAATGPGENGGYVIALNVGWVAYLLDISHANLSSTKNRKQIDHFFTYHYLSSRLEITLKEKNIHFWLKNDSEFTIPVPKGFINISRINDSFATINTYNGAYWLDIKQKKVTDSFLKGQTVNSVVEDSEGNLWLSTMGMGLYRLGSSRFVNYSFRTKKTDLPVFCIRKYDSVFYLGTDHFYLWSMSQDRMRMKNTLVFEGSTRGRITAIVKLSGRKMVIGTDYGLFLLEDGKKKASVQPMAIKSIISKDDHTLLVCSASNSFLVQSDDLKFIGQIWPFRSTCGYIKGGLYYIGTLDGLYLVDHDKKSSYPSDSTYSLKSRISDIKESADGTLWVATDGGGISGYKDGKTLVNFKEKDGLTSNICRTIFISGKDIWVGTDKGLNKIRLFQGTYTITSFTSKDGLSSDIINSIYVEGKDVFAGTPDGLAFFNETGILKRSQCKLRVTRLTVSNKEWPMDTTGFYVDHNDNTLQIDFVGISYNSAGSISYQYRLIGLENVFRTTTQNSLTYPSLPSGTYELRLQATNKFGVKSNQVDIKFTIGKLFWERTWFRLVALIGLAALIWLIFSYRVRSIRKKEAEKTLTVTRMAELEQMALRSQMNPHFIFNCLNSIQEYVMDKDVLGANEFITKFSYLIRQTLDISSKPVISLYEEINYISTYMELEIRRFGNKFVGSVTVAEDIDRQVFFIPPMILQPYIENAIRHGIGHRQDKKGRIEVKMECRGDQFVCTIEDNGVGRQMAAFYKSANAINYQSRGMSLVAKRIDMLNKTNLAPVLIGIDDLLNTEGKPSGTRVTLSFPLDQTTKQTN